MKKYILLAVALFALTHLAAQNDGYGNSKIMEQDLNGNAGYVGMGGAMDALGGNLSTINTNPAGIGVFRHVAGSVSFGLVGQSGKGANTNTSFDQAGFVYPLSYHNNQSFVNFAFNYHKSSNFDYILSVANRLEGASQNKQAYINALDKYDERNGTFSTNLSQHSNGDIYNTKDEYNTLDNLYYNNFNVGDDNVLYYSDASDYNMYRRNTGYIGEYDFNVSGNIKDWFYYGVTFGLHDVHYHGNSVYTENIVDGNNTNIGTVTVNDEHQITGLGWDLKLGMIFRVSRSFPLRIGLNIQTPAAYKLTSSDNVTLINGTNLKTKNSPNNTLSGNTSEQGYSVTMPIKFGIALGYTFGDYLAIGASYNYGDYDGAGHALTRVSTVKLGLSYNPTKPLTLRLGYNYISSIFNEDASKGELYYPATDYTNWGATNRFTCGIGYNIKHWWFDLAYAYTVTNGDFYPFADTSYRRYEGYSFEDVLVPLFEDVVANHTQATKVSDNHHQLIFTLSYVL